MSDHEYINRADHIPQRAFEDMLGICRKYQVKKLILFGSRARGDHHPKSDIDLAVEGCGDFPSFAYDIDTHTWTLLQFDIINLDEPVADSLLQEIRNDGVVLYEKV